MKLMIYIPDKDIPKRQDILSVDLSFVDGQVGQCTYPFEVLHEEEKTGHWEWLTEDKYRCSNCNSETRVDECLNEPMYVFCPFCGAKMKSEDKE